MEWILSEDILGMNQGSGGQYDIVSKYRSSRCLLQTYLSCSGWDPRGVGSTIPKVQCFESGTEETAFWNGSIRGNLLELRGNFSDAAERQWFYSHVNETDKALIRFGKQCDKASRYMLKYIGTAANVRDMVALHDYLEGDKPINYWGIS